MTRKDYELVAGVLREQVRDPNLDIVTLADVATKLAYAFENDNPRFDPQRFWDEIWKQD